ncbi:hypothetical protein NE865_08573 [Phthorimaea operculella]|nr:hypothetical protein NE865_08573 [Phthorimaea operculella]
MRPVRALAALYALVVSGLHALESPSHPINSDRLSRTLAKTLGVAESSPARRLLDCGRSLGPTKCISALSVWRAERAIEIFKNGREAQFDLREDVEQFPWQKYGNISEEQLYAQLSEDTEKLLRFRSLSLTLPGYSFELESKGNGTLNVDVLRNEQSGRTMSKKTMKEFYNLIPVLLLPGLVMSAILPFVLPALKMTTILVGMLNNMALSGAVFTLLRNNAFNDHYEKKIIYVNEGYKNEKLSEPYFSKDLHKFNLDHFDEYSGSASNVQPAIQPLEQPVVQGTQPVNMFAEENFNAMQEAMNTDWINQYYGNAGLSDSGSKAVSPNSLGNFDNVVSPSSLNIVSAFVGVNNAGGTSNQGGFSNFGSVSSPSSLNAESSNTVITVANAPQAETKVRRSIIGEIKSARLRWFGHVERMGRILRPREHTWVNYQLGVLSIAGLTKSKKTWERFKWPIGDKQLKTGKNRET